MIAYCDRNGLIQFAVVKPANGARIAEHRNAALLRRAIIAAGPQEFIAFRHGKQTGEPQLAVPWFHTSKGEDEEQQAVDTFSEKVEAWLREHWQDS